MPRALAHRRQDVFGARPASAVFVVVHLAERNVLHALSPGCVFGIAICSRALMDLAAIPRPYWQQRSVSTDEAHNARVVFIGRNLAAKKMWEGLVAAIFST